MWTYNAMGTYILVVTLATVFVIILVARQQRARKDVAIWLMSGLVGLLLGAAGAAAIIQMLYGDGFFHADLHPGNLLVLPGPKDGFIDLGMVGRFDDDLRRTLLYYFYCLVMGDAANLAFL